MNAFKRIFLHNWWLKLLALVLAICCVSTVSVNQNAGVLHEQMSDTMDALLIAILPEYQSKGVNSLMFQKLIHNCRRDGFTKLESTRELADNIAVQNLWSKLEHKQHKRARTYKKILK